MLDLKDILRREGDNAINRIGGNIFKAGITRQGINRTGQYYASPTRQGANASGKTIQSMKVTATETELTISGRDKFSQLETGTPPNSGVTPQTLFSWGKYKNQPFGKEYTFKTAISHSVGINKKGTKLFRLGGRKDIFTNEVEPLVEAISKQIDKRFTEITIVD